MRIPRIRELYNLILDYLKGCRTATLNEIRKDLALYFLLPDEIAYDRKDNNTYSIYESRVNQACWDLWHAGLIERVSSGKYTIKKDGEVASDDYVDKDYLRDIPEYEEYESSRYHTSGSDDQEADSTKSQRRRPEFFEIKKPSLSQLVELRRQDTLFSNLIATGEYIYDNSQIMMVPQEVIIGDMTYQEFKASVGSTGDNEPAIICSKDANGSGKMRSKERIRHHDPQPRGSRGPREWSNPYPPGTGTAKNFNMIQDIYDFNINNKGVFHICFKHLIKDIYHITYPRLAIQSGVSEHQIRRMCNTPDTNVNVRDLAAIVLALQGSAYIFEEFVSLAGYNPKSPMWQPYAFICDTMKYCTYKQVNEECRKAGREEIFTEEQEKSGRSIGSMP